MASVTAGSSLDHAIVYTLIYGDLFNFPMTDHEIYHFLIGMAVSYEAVQFALENPSPWLESHIDQKTPYYALAGRGEVIFPLRKERELISTHLWKKARFYSRWLGMLPFVRMVALTGALAMHNARSKDDDLDYLLVVKDGRVWLARLFSVGLVRLCKLWGATLCPNYVLSEKALSQKDHTLFMAHEITQMIPFIGFDYYWHMRHANGWVGEILPNASVPFYQETDKKPRLFGRWLQFFMEWVLGGYLGNRLETWEQRRKIRKFEAQAIHSQDTRLDSDQVKGHFADYGFWTSHKFQERVAALGMRLYNGNERNFDIITDEFFPPSAAD